MLETPETTRAWSALNKAKAAQVALEFLESEVFNKQHELDQQVFVKLQHGDTLDPQYALQVFLQKWAVWQFQFHLAQIFKSGQNAARVLGPMMEGNSGE